MSEVTLSTPAPYVRDLLGVTFASDPRTVTDFAGQTHDPNLRQSCRDFERCADEAESIYLAMLDEPCPHCGHKRAVKPS